MWEGGGGAAGIAGAVDTVTEAFTHRRDDT